MSGTGVGVSKEIGKIVGLELSAGFLFDDDGSIYTLKSVDVTIGASWPPISASTEQYEYSGDAMDLNGFSVGYEQNGVVGSGVEFGLETWNGIPRGFSGNNL